MSLRDVMLKDLEHGLAIVRDGHEIVPAWRIFTPDPATRVRCRIARRARSCVQPPGIVLNARGRREQCRLPSCHRPERTHQIDARSRSIESAPTPVFGAGLAYLP